MLYTRKGDGGTSGLYGTAVRLPKNSAVYEALGTLDELNSLIGYCRARAGATKSRDIDLPAELLKIQESLFLVQAEVAGSHKTISHAVVGGLEESIECIESHITNPHAFVIPGANELSALLDVCRAVSRRAERTVVAIAMERGLSENTMAYLNRLSSMLYACARYAVVSKRKELSPHY